MGTQGQLASPSDSTVEGGPGLVLDSVLCSNVNLSNDSRFVPSEQLLPLVLLELVLVVGVLVYQLAEPLGSVVLDVLEGGEGDMSSELLLLVGLLSPCSLSNHLHVGYPRLGVVLLDVLGGSKGGVQHSTVRVNLLSLFPN